ncbi:hypothetical protein C1645_825538 [Glomus cerebriforme]|uniref:Uncharacterized protein n=1 Tax=Glomus cerebriforme TaxID=658196 RepID=A0A397T1Q0_9GLOM|nr:hypothetical protein C1645_825538 [Glomus cerebriforme]
MDQSEEVNIEDEAIVQGVINAVGKDDYRNIKDILQYLILNLVHKRILNPYNLTIHLRISGDGRNVDEMKKIKVNFQFWQDQGSKTWNYTSLIGDDKLKVLQFFDLTKILSRCHAAMIQDL